MGLLNSLLCSYNRHWILSYLLIAMIILAILQLITKNEIVFVVVSTVWLISHIIIVVSSNKKCASLQDRKFLEQCAARGLREVSPTAEVKTVNYV